MLGIGYPDETKHRRDHHFNPTLEGLKDYRYSSLSKQVHVEEWK